MLLKRYSIGPRCAAILQLSVLPLMGKNVNAFYQLTAEQVQPMLSQLYFGINVFVVLVVSIDGNQLLRPCRFTLSLVTHSARPYRPVSADTADVALHAFSPTPPASSATAFLLLLDASKVFDPSAVQLNSDSTDHTCFRMNAVGKRRINGPVQRSVENKEQRFFSMGWRNSARDSERGRMRQRTRGDARQAPALVAH